MSTRLRSTAAAWPALAFFLGMWPAAQAGSWLAVWLFCLSGTVLAVTRYRLARGLPPRHARAMARRLGLQLHGTVRSGAVHGASADRNSPGPDQNGAQP